MPALSGLSLESVLHKTDVQKAFDVFYAGAMSLFDQYYPVHTITLFNRDPQFITPRINALLKRRNRLMRRGDVATANSLTDRIRQKKITAHSCSHLLSNVPHGSTEMWQMIRQVTGKQKRPIDKLVNVNVEDLNRHYATISTNVQYEKPNPNATVLSQLQVFSEYNVFRMLHKIKPTAMGLDGLSDWFIHLAAPAFATHLQPVTRTFSSAGAVEVELHFSHTQGKPTFLLLRLQADLNNTSIITNNGEDAGPVNTVSGAVVELRGGPRGAGPPERPVGPLETPGLRGYKGASKRPPLKSPVKFNT